MIKNKFLYFILIIIIQGCQAYQIDKNSAANQLANHMVGNLVGPAVSGLFKSSVNSVVASTAGGGIAGAGTAGITAFVVTYAVTGDIGESLKAARTSASAGFISGAVGGYAANRLSNFSKSPPEAAERLEPKQTRLPQTEAEQDILYRAVDDREFQMLRTSRQFEIDWGKGTEMKYFAKSASDAHIYGSKLYPNGYQVIKAQYTGPQPINNYWYPNSDAPMGAYIFGYKEVPYLYPILPR